MNIETIVPVLLSNKTTHGMCSRYLGVLALVCAPGAKPQTIRGMAAQLGVQKPVITRAVDKLGDEMKLIERRVDPHDRRSMNVTPRAAGLKLIATLNGALTKAEASYA
jgi:DNA-binding MarR family transcriptional regulator